MNMIRKYYQIAKWIWNHRAETDCRQKWRRMDRELRGVK